MKISLDFILNSVDGKLITGDRQGFVYGICTDSRNVTPGTLFLALKGDNFDGHDFVVETLKKGASAAIVSKTINNLSEVQDQAIIMVEDTLTALQKLASKYREKFNIPIIAITGSVGKTTIKDLLATCLMSRFKTLKTPGNYNNDIGLPLTILDLEVDHQAAVVEMAMRAPGEISKLATIARPTCAIISNVEAVHLETMGSIENIASAKCEVLSSLGKNDFAVINGDNELLLNTARNFVCRKYTFGYSRDCDIRIINVVSQNEGINIELQVFDKKDIFFCPIPAKRLATNVASAVAMAYLLGVSIEDIKNSLIQYVPSGNRLSLINLEQGGIVINDTYNANPLSMITALEVSRRLASGRKSVAVLGDMFELGEYEIPGHLKVGQRVAELNIDVLVTIGERSQYIAQGAIESGMQPGSVHHFVSREDALKWLKNNLSHQEIVLFKASRGMKLETLLDDWMQ